VCKKLKIIALAVNNKKVELFNLMALPTDDEVDLTDIWGPDSIYCEKKRAFLLIDAPSNWTNPNTGQARNNFSIGAD